ncbi:MAG: recombination regulator RecX [Alkalibacterium sp.]|nr:recombination regulator RecX [Alkalibacterium sp.]
MKKENERKRESKLIELGPSAPSSPSEHSKESKGNRKRHNLEQKGMPVKETSPDKEFVITKVQAQKAKNRFNIYINDEYAFPVDDNLLVQHRLIKGKELTKEDIDELRAKGELSKGYQAALHYLNFKMRSEKEIVDYLKKKEYQTIGPIIEKLKSNRLINDEEYAKSFVRTNSLLKLEGPKKIERTLYTKGLSKGDVLTGLDEYSEDKQQENASKLAEKVLNRQRNKSSREMTQKIREQLMTHGFDSDVIQRTLDELEIDQSDDEEYEALQMQGEKAWTRYSRKHSGYDLISKTKTFLYSKGYPREMIDRFIEEKEELQ